MKEEFTDKNSLYFKDHTSFVEISKIEFKPNESWTVHIVLKEFPNNEVFNFFLGNRGSYTNSFLRENEKIYYRADDKSYVGGITYKKGEVLDLFVSYDNGLFTFKTKKDMVTDRHLTKLKLKTIGSGYNGKSHEQPTIINKVTIWKMAIDSNNHDVRQQSSLDKFDEYLVGNWNFEVDSGEVLLDKSLKLNHGYCHNVEWIKNNKTKSLIVSDTKISMETNNKIKIFPIGTSRLHEPLSLVKQSEILFSGVGYFHTSSQIVDWIQILNGEKNLDPEEAKFFFRKDQTPENIFDLNLWDNEDFEETIKKKKLLFDEANCLIIEISTTSTHKYKDLHINGNPNFKYNLSYAEAWGENGYYEKKHPEMKIKRFLDVKDVDKNIIYINQYLSDTGKKALLLGHLINPRNPNKTRTKHNKMLKNAIDRLETKHIFFYDVSHLVDEFGFRILDDGTTDIHHLPWKALERQAIEMEDYLKSQL